MIYSFEIYIDRVNRVYDINEFHEKLDWEHDNDMQELDSIQIWYDEVGNDSLKHDVIVGYISDKKIFESAKFEMYKKIQSILNDKINNKQKEIENIKKLKRTNKKLLKLSRIKKLGNI